MEPRSFDAQDIHSKYSIRCNDAQKNVPNRVWVVQWHLRCGQEEKGIKPLTTGFMDDWLITSDHME